MLHPSRTVYEYPVSAGHANVEDISASVFPSQDTRRRADRQEADCWGRSGRPLPPPPVCCSFHAHQLLQQRTFDS